MSTGTGQPLIEPLDLSQPFKPASWLTKIDFIKQLILNNNVLVSILGEQNGGKTTFVNLLSTSLSPIVKSVVVTANPLFSQDDLLNQVGEKLQHKGEMTLSNFATESQENSTHTLLIIDDAHFLPNSFIEATLQTLKQQDKSCFFHVCLVSNYSLAAALNNLGTEHYQDMVHSLELGPLTEKETESYIREQLGLFPGVANSLSPERIRQFYQLTEGNIVGINTQMSAFFNQEKPIIAPKSKSWRGLATAAGIVIVVLGSAYVWKTQEVLHEQPQNLAIELPEPTPELAVTVATDTTQDIAIDLANAAALAANSSLPSYDVAAVKQELQATDLKKVNLVQENELDLPVDNSMVVMDKVVVIPKHIETTAKRGAIAKVNVNPAKVQASKFTIQLLAGQSKKELLQFAKANHIQAQVFKAQSKGKSWYVLTYGQYQGREEAKNAISHLPKSLAKLKPWIRGVGDLKLG